MQRATFPPKRTVLVVTDFPIQNEVDNDQPWSGASHLSLLSDLTKAGISPRDIHTTYLSFERQAKDSYDWGTEIKKKKNLTPDSEFVPIPNHKDLFMSLELSEQVFGLLTEISKVEPKLIIVAGKWSYFFLTGNATQAQTQNSGSSQKPMGGLAKHRASLEKLSECWELADTLVFPILPPVTKQRSPDKIPVMKWDYAKAGDLYRALKEGTEISHYTDPKVEYLPGTDYSEVCNWFNKLLFKLAKEPVLVSVDIETRHNAMIDCIGFAYKTDSGLCVPFATLANPNFWSEDEEFVIYRLMNQVLTHKNVKLVGQNFSYDIAYIYKYWLIEAVASIDTMVLHHVLYNNMQKDLAFLASVYCDKYTFWKDDQNGLDEVRWRYNVKDILYTLEISEVLQEVLSQQPESLQNFYKFQQNELAPALNRVMNRGIRIDLEKKEELHRQLSEILTQVEKNLNYLIGEDFNPKSTPQVRAVFGDLLGIKAKLNRKTGSESFGSEYMLGYLEEYPLLRPIITLMLEYRSIGIFVRTFLSAKVDEDGRMRTSYNVAGTKTYRLASRKNPFGNGMNLQNVPKEGKIDLKFSLEALEDGNEDETEVLTIGETNGITELPNCKRLFIPDPGYTFFDIDYSGADARVVAWDADCKFLMDIFNDESKDLYSTIAGEYYKRPISKKDKERQIFKAVCHACVTGDHEVLTKSGWVAIEDVEDTVAIAVWDADTWEVKFEVPVFYNRDLVPETELLYFIEGAAFSFTGTQDHKFPYTVDEPRNLQRKEAAKLPKSARIPYVGNYSGGSVEASSDYMRLIAALQADGHIEHISKAGVVTYRFKFARERKIVRLRNLLTRLGVDFKEFLQEDSSSNGNIRTIFSFKDFLKPEMKKLDWWILAYSQEAIIAFVDELKYWDGCIQETSAGSSKRTSISTTDKKAAEIMQTLYHLTGNGSKVLTRPAHNNKKEIYEVSVNNREFHNLSSGTRGYVEHTGTVVHCPQTSTGNFMVRRKGRIYVSGNTNYLGKAPAIASAAGLLVHEVEKVQKFYFSACPEVREWQRRHKSNVDNFGFVENAFGARGYFLDRTDTNLYNKAIAWIPQSTIGIMVNKGLVNIDQKEDPKKVQVLLQTHDSLSGQFLSSDLGAADRIVKHMSVPLKFKKELVIPAGIVTSTLSYGDCK